MQLFSSSFRRTKLVAALFMLVISAPCLAKPPPGTKSTSFPRRFVDRAEAIKNPYRKIVWLQLARRWFDWCDDGCREAFDGTLKALVAPDTPPAVRRLAFRWMAERYFEKGHYEKGSSTFRQLGTILHWRMSEPVPSYLSRAGETPDSMPRVPSLDQRSQWREVKALTPSGRLDVEAFTDTSRAGYVWLESRFRASRKARAILWAGCQSACTVWMDGEAVLHITGLNTFSEDQRAVRLVLSEGIHELLVRLEGESESWRISVSVSDYTGQRLRELEPVPARRRALHARRVSATVSKAHVPSLPEWFAARLTGDYSLLEKAEAAYMLSYLQSYRGDGKDLQGEIDALSRHCLSSSTGDDSSVQATLLLSLATTDHHRKKTLLEWAAGSGRLAEADWLLAIHYQLLNKPWEFARMASTAVSRHPKFLPAWAAWYEALADCGLEGLAARKAEVLAEENPRTPALRTVAADLLMRLGLYGKAKRQLELLWQTSKTQDVARRLYSLHRHVGRHSVALQWLERLEELAGPQATTGIEAARCLLDTGQPARALERLRQVLDNNPSNLEAGELVVRALLAMGNNQEAVERARSYLKRHPNRLDFASWIEIASGGSAEATGFYSNWKLDGRELAEQWWEKTSRNPSLEERTHRLADVTVVKLHTNGTVSRFHQLVVYVGDEAGVNSYKTVTETYLPASQRLEVLECRIIRPEGVMDERVVTEDSDLSIPTLNLYSDLHQRRFSFPDLRRGDVLEVSTLATDSGERALLDGYFGDLVLLAFPHPVESFAYVLVAPPDPPVFHYFPATSGLSFRKTTGRRQVLEWRGSRLEASPSEPGSPSAVDSLDFIHVSTIESWQKLSSWYHGFVSRATATSKEIQRVARQLTRGVGSRRKKVESIYRFVTNNVRYVAVELGKHGYVPSPAANVLEQRFGDCKDKSALLVALLRAVSIPAELVLVRAGSAASMMPEPASLELFNHAIVHVDKPDIWLDPTVDYYPAGMLPPAIQGVFALPVTARGSSPIVTPTSNSEQNSVTIQSNLSFGSDGSGIIEANLSLGGYFAAQWREQIAVSDKQPDDIVSRNIQQLLPGTRVLEVSAHGIYERTDPLTVRVRLDASELLRQVSAGGAGPVSVPMLLRKTSYRQVFAPWPKRSTDLLLGPPWQVNWRICVEPPPGWEIGGFPEPAHLSEGGVEVRVKLGVRNRKRICLEARASITRSMIPVEDYAVFSKALSKADGILNQVFLLVRRGAGT